MGWNFQVVFAFFTCWIVVLVKIFSIGYAFFTILHLHTLSFRELICYIRAFLGWIVELQILKTSVHFSSYPNFKMMYAFRKMFVSCSIRFWGEIFKKWSLFFTCWIVVLVLRKYFLLGTLSSLYFAFTHCHLGKCYVICALFLVE